MTIFEVFGLTIITWEQVIGAIPGSALAYWLGWREANRRAQQERP